MTYPCSPKPLDETRKEVVTRSGSYLKSQPDTRLWAQVDDLGVNLQELQHIPPVSGIGTGVSKSLRCFGNLNVKEEEMEKDSVEGWKERGLLGLEG